MGVSGDLLAALLGSGQNCESSQGRRRQQEQHPDFHHVITSARSYRGLGGLGGFAGLRGGDLSILVALVMAHRAFLMLHASLRLGGFLVDHPLISVVLFLGMYAADGAFMPVAVLIGLPFVAIGVLAGSGDDLGLLLSAGGASESQRVISIIL